MSGVVSVAMSAIQAVSLPEFSRLQHQPEALRKSAMTCLRLTASVTLPALCGLAVVSTPLMATIGKSWIPASHALTVLCLLGVAIVFAYFTGPLLQALSRPRELALLEWGRMILGVLALIPAAMIARHHSIAAQILGIALARFVIGAFIVAPIFVYILMKLCKITIREFVSLVIPSATSSASVVLSVLLFTSTGLLQTAAPILLLASEVAIGGLVGIVVLLALDSDLRRSTEAILSRNYDRLLALKQSA
jgi:O-antigen/teichoic acid export membrane protein